MQYVNDSLKTLVTAMAKMRHFDKKWDRDPCWQDHPCSVEKTKYLGSHFDMGIPNYLPTSLKYYFKVRLN